MEWLNYHHLLYFWTVAREGSIVRASRELRLSQPTISSQVRQLEDTLGVKLFERAGRGLVLTDAGRTAFRYAEGIFTLGREMGDALKGKASGRPLRLSVGVADVVPKLIAYRLLEPALKLAEPVQVVCLEDKPERLLAALSVYELDLVLTDAPIGGRARVRAYNHLLGESAVSFFATAELARRWGKDFPASLDGAPFLLPTPGTSIRPDLDHWFDETGIRPNVVGEFDDSALLKAFGERGVGLFCAPTVIEAEVQHSYRVKVIGQTESVRERFFAISAERRIKHPAVVAISAAAKEEVFG